MAVASLAHGRRLADPASRLDTLRRVHVLQGARHAAFVLALAAGAAAMVARGWSIGHPRWLAVKIGLVVFLLVPLEAMHAWTWHVWIGRGLRGATASALPRAVERGLGIDEMLRAISIPLLGIALLLLLWLSLSHPF